MMEMNWAKCTILHLIFKGKNVHYHSCLWEKDLLHVSSVWIDSIIAKKLRHTQVTFFSKKYRMPLPFYSEGITAVSLLAPHSSDSFQFWGLEVQCRPYQTEVQVLAVCILRGALWENPFSVCLGHCWNSASWMWRKKVSVFFMAVS